MIFLKNIFKIALIVFLSGAIFFGAAYAYLDYSLNKTTTDIDQKDYTVPYKRTPENCGIVFIFPNSSATLVFLDFDKKNIRLLNIDDYEPSRPEYNGYSADYTIETSYELIEGIVDRVGGIEIVYNDEKMRYTGVQVIDLIAYGKVKDIKRQILMQVFEQISKNGFLNDDFVYIIENSKSNLSFIDCIDWIEYLQDMSGRVNFIN